MIIYIDERNSSVRILQSTQDMSIPRYESIAKKISNLPF